MVMDIGLFGTLRKLKLTSASLRVDDDFIDRLNHYYTGILIVVFTLVISAKQYVGQPLQCWVPAQFTSAMEQYAENYCWVQNTYYLPLTSHIPHSHSSRESTKIGYYQWVPFMLAGEALLFYLPYVCWRLMNWQSGVNFKAIMLMAGDAQSVNPESRGKTIRVLARHIQDAIRLQAVRKQHLGCLGKCKWLVDNSICLLCSRQHGMYLTCLYLLIKLLYLCNCVGQFFLLNAFLDSPYQLFGLDLLHNMLTGKTWADSGQFPRVTMCDFQIRVLGNLHRHTVQCVLVINLFNEKIFVFLWFWFLFVTLLTAVSLAAWLLRQLIPKSRRNFVASYLRLSNSFKPTTDHSVLKQFLTEHLRCDGVFVLRMVSLNAGDVIATEVMRALWMDFKCSYSAQTNNSIRLLPQRMQQQAVEDGATDVV